MRLILGMLVRGLSCDLIPISIVITALLGTAAVFACFSGAAVLAQRRQYLYLGALASSALVQAVWLNHVSLMIYSQH